MTSTASDTLTQTESTASSVPLFLGWPVAAESVNHTNENVCKSILHWTAKFAVAFAFSTTLSLTPTLLLLLCVLNCCTGL